MSKEREPNRPILPQALVFLGITLFLFSLLALLAIFWPVIKAEISYQINRPDADRPIVSISQNKTASPNEIIPVDGDFSIIIPKIGVNAKVIKNVDPLNDKIYQRELVKGVAHAKGTLFPGGGGNIFIFAHSAGNPIEANRYNAVFYLLSKLGKDDRVVLYFDGKSFDYLVSEVKTVDPKETDYLKGANEEILTLMTCWPPATTSKRLIVRAKPKAI